MYGKLEYDMQTWTHFPSRTHGLGNIRQDAAAKFGAVHQPYSDQKDANM